MSDPNLKPCPVCGRLAQRLQMARLMGFACRFATNCLTRPRRR